MASDVRVRFAPSPTGPLHLGGVRTALYNYLFAKKNNGTFILRIEDTDQTRFVPGAEEYIIDSLKWAGIEPEEGVGFGDGEYGPYRQSERKNMYKAFAEQLVDSGHAYYAFDTPGELEEMRERVKAQGNPSPQYNSVTRQYMKNSLTLPADEVNRRMEAGEDYVIRIKMPRNEEVRFHDLIRGWVIFDSTQLDDKVLFKSDGMPTYHLANVVDDHLMKISHVIRGEEWLPSTPLHVLLYRYFGWEETMPEFAHLPLILKPDGNGKLSKRDGDRLGFPVFPMNWQDPETGEQSKGFKERGFIPAAFINFLAFLGWNPGTEQEIFSKDELIDTFTIDRIGKSGARFDFEKAKWFNQQYLKEMPDGELAEFFMRDLKVRDIQVSPAFAREVCRLLKERIYFISELYDEGYYFFEQVKNYDEKIISKKWSDNKKPFFNELKTNLGDIQNFSTEAIEKEVKGLLEKYKFGFGDILPLFRVMLCGMVQGPPIFDVAALLGKDTVVQRMEKGIEIFDSQMVK